MKLHILIDRDEDLDSEGYLTVFQSKEGLINCYIKFLKEYYFKHYNRTKEILRDSLHESDVEMLKASRKESYDKDLIDLNEYFKKYDSNCFYVVKEEILN